MNLCVSLFIISVFVSASSSQSPLQILQSDQNDDKPYAFEYAVKDQHDRTQFGRREQSDGNKVQGVYSVNLPDGRQQTVQYEAEDSTGFKASVTYDGNAKMFLNQERADKTSRKTSKNINSNEAPNMKPIPFPVIMPMPDHNPMIILKRPSMSIKTKPMPKKTKPTSNSKPSMIQNMLTSIKQFSENFSEDFSEDMNSLNQNKPQRPNSKLKSSGLARGQHPQLTHFNPVASEPSMSVSLNTDNPTSIKTKSTSKPSMIQSILFSIKEFSDDFSDNMNSWNQNKPQRPNRNAIKSVASEPSMSVTLHTDKPTPLKTKSTSNPGLIKNILSSIKQLSDDFSENLSSLNPNKHQLPVIKPSSLHPNEKLPQPVHHIITTKRSTLHGSKQHSSIHLPPVYNINTKPAKGPEPHPPPDIVYPSESDVHKPPPDRPTPKYRPYRPPTCLGCG